MTDLVNQQQTLEEKMREDRDSLVERLHRQTAEYSAFKLENERLKVGRESQARDIRVESRWLGTPGWAQR